GSSWPGGPATTRPKRRSDVRTTSGCVRSPRACGVGDSTAPPRGRVPQGSSHALPRRPRVFRLTVYESSALDSRGFRPAAARAAPPRPDPPRFRAAPLTPGARLSGCCPPRSLPPVPGPPLLPPPAVAAGTADPTLVPSRQDEQDLNARRAAWIETIHRAAPG